jgi:Zn-dependent protease with chaperone function
VCELLPWWDAWMGPGLAGALTIIPLALLLEVLNSRARRELGAMSGGHWTERARRAVELKTTALGFSVVFGVLACFLAGSWRTGSGCGRGAAPVFAAAGLAALLFARASGVIAAAYTGRRASFRARVRSALSSSIALRPSLLVVALALACSGFAPRGGAIWIWVAAVALAAYLISTGVLYGLSRALGLARPARAKVVAAVERARKNLPVTVRGVDEIAWLMPNAFVFPLTRRMAFSEPLAEALSEDELYAIALHELGHLKESAFSSWFRPALSLVLLPLAVSLPLVQSDRWFELLVLCALCFGVAVFGLRRSRKLEHAADAHAAEHSSDYARALEAIYRLAGIPPVVSKRSTHPSLYDRLLAAGAAPDYPRPSPPSRRGLVLAFALVPFLVFGYELAFPSIRQFVAGEVGAERAPFVRLALRGARADLVALGGSVRQKDPRLAAQLYVRASGYLPEDPHFDETVRLMENVLARRSPEPFEAAGAGH